jgi:Ni,Fe-hydrogenase III small subunit
MMFREFNILKKHGWQHIPKPDLVVLTKLFRGRPEISTDITSDEAGDLENLCPVQAIFQDNGLCIDLGKCVFCKECEYAGKGKIRFTNDHKIAASSREDLIIRSGITTAVRFNHNAVRPEIKRFFRKSLKLRQVSAAGDNSCEMELNAAGNVNFDMGRYGIEFVASPRHADGIVVTGPVSENMARALEITWDAVASPKILVMAGSEAIGGGLFANSPAIQRSFLSKHKPDLFVPGNPLHPLSFIHGLRSLISK